MKTVKNKPISGRFLHMINTRYALPNKFDAAPYGSVVKVKGDNTEEALWIQLCYEPEGKPDWQSVGKLLEVVFEKHLEDKSFMQYLLDCYKEKILVDIAKLDKLT
jgi:hypothetical protein